MEKWAVEARIFDRGRIVAKVRKAEPSEENHSTETRTCDIWVDIFDTQEEACAFAQDYKKA